MSKIVHATRVVFLFCLNVSFFLSISRPKKYGVVSAFVAEQFNWKEILDAHVTLEPYAAEIHDCQLGW